MTDLEAIEKAAKAAAQELKPCPFCGSGNIYVDYKGQPAKYISMSCAYCGASGPAIPYGATEPIDNAWNTRAVQAELKQLRELAEKMHGALVGVMDISNTTDDITYGEQAGPIIDNAQETLAAYEQYKGERG